MVPANRFALVVTIRWFLNLWRVGLRQVKMNLDGMKMVILRLNIRRSIWIYYVEIEAPEVRAFD
jgi:hypothetical protein